MFRFNQCLVQHYNISETTKLRSVEDTFQKKLKEDIPNIKQSPNVFVFVDKASNIYGMPEQQHKKLFQENVTKTYKKALPKLETSINIEAKTLSDSLTWMTTSSV